MANSYTFTDNKTATVGLATKKTDHDLLAANTDYLKEALDTIMSSSAADGILTADSMVMSSSSDPIDVTLSANSSSTETGLNMSSTQAGTGVLYGITNFITHNGAQSAAAFNNKVISGGTGTSRDHIVGVQNVTQHSSTGTLNEMLGFSSDMTISDAMGTVTDLIHFLADVPTHVGTSAITNAYGLLIRDQTDANVTNAYAIRTLGAAPVRLAGDLKVDDGAGILVGHTAQLTTSTVPEVQVLGSSAGGTDVNMLLACFNTTNAASASFQFLKSGSGTIGGNTIVADGESLGGMRWYGDDGVDYASEAASIIAEVDGTPGTGDMPGRLTFRTTADGAQSATVQVTIDSAGRIICANMPTSDPSISGALYSDSGTIKISA